MRELLNKTIQSIEGYEKNTKPGCLQQITELLNALVPVLIEKSITNGWNIEEKLILQLRDLLMAEEDEDQVRIIDVLKYGILIEIKNIALIEEQE